MDRKCLSAYTAPTGLGYPPYINATLNHDGTITVLVRGDSYDDGRGYRVSGHEASITMSPKDFKRWLGETVSEMMIASAKCDESSRAIIRRTLESSMNMEDVPGSGITFVLPGATDTPSMRGPILHALFPTCEAAQQTMVRPQEFYESPIVGIRGEVFSLSEYQHQNAMLNGGTYLYDWTGFNIPGKVVREFFDRFDSFSPGELALKAAVDSLGSPEDFYLIATAADDPDSDTFPHEVCHARWALDPVFRKHMEAAVTEMQAHEPEAFAAFHAWLIARGYDESVLRDECQAYMATTPRGWWTPLENGGLSLGISEAFWRAGEPFREVANAICRDRVVRRDM